MKPAFFIALGIIVLLVSTIVYLARKKCQTNLQTLSLPERPLEDKATACSDYCTSVK